jgi:hypothetical protein
VSSLIWEVLVA